MARPAPGPAPYRPLFFLLIVILGVSLPWYLSYEPAMEDMTQHLRLFLMLLPLVLLLAVKFLSSPHPPSLPLPQADPSTIHRVGGSAVGIGILLVVILAMIWYQSDFLGSWGIQ